MIFALYGTVRAARLSVKGGKPVVINKLGDSTVNLCLASDNNYAPYLSTMLYSVRCHRNTAQAYDIIILHSGISDENQKSILSLACDNFTIRFVDVSEIQKLLEHNIGAHYSAATNYRLLLFSELFCEYEKIIYLDCDMIVLRDVAELFFTDLGDSPAAACEDAGLRWLSYTKRAIFIGGTLPYNADNYRTDALGMKHPEGYFNAGVILFDLNKCRGLFTYEDAVTLLRSKQFNYNDQDTLNILLDGKVKLIDIAWNYQNIIDALLSAKKPVYSVLFYDMKRENPAIIHYIGGKKPWNAEVPFGGFYHKYQSALSKEDT